MKLIPANYSEFDIYGKVIEGYELASFIEALSKLPKPMDSVVYVPSEPTLENTPLFKEIENSVFGGIPIQIGYCNGNNFALNCLEYHRGSELIIAEESLVLLVAYLPMVKNNKIDSTEVKAFEVPAGTAVLIYETTLHYAPCSNGTNGFRTAIVLPKGTNTDKPEITIRNDEDKLLWARNKWLIAHKSTSEAESGAVIGITGENIILSI